MQFRLGKFATTVSAQANKSSKQQLGSIDAIAALEATLIAYPKLIYA